MGPEHADWSYVCWLIHDTAARLAASPEFRGEDVRDLEQDLFKVLLSRWPLFNPARAGARTFISMVVRHGAITMACRRKVRRRYLGEIVPLEEGHEAPRSGPEAELRWDLGEDDRRVLEGAPPELASLAELLKDASPSDAARRLGRSRGWVYHAIDELRERMKRAGLDEYLD